MTSSPTTKEPGVRRRAVVALGILGAFGLVAWVLSRSGPAKPEAAVSGPGTAALVTMLTEQQRITSAGRVRARCEGAVAEPCICVKAAIHEALDASLVDVAKGLLERGKASCAEPLDGQGAEIAARSGAPGAEAAALAVVAVRASDPYAAYALSHLAWLGGDRGNAVKWVETAVAAGRGGPAHLLVGLLALAAGEIEPARGAFTRVLETEPADVAALYDIALCDHRLDRYRMAREGYLAVLRKNPGHLDARYNIALLTHGAGFREEAAHHLAELRQAASSDARVAELEARFAAPQTPGPSGSASAAPAPAPSGAAAIPRR